MERGQTLVEVVLVLPLVALFLWGSWELALSFGEKYMAQYGAFAGARQGVVAGGEPEQKAKQTALRIITGGLGRRLNPLLVTVQCQREDESFEVQVSWWRQRLWRGPKQIRAGARLGLEN